MKLTTNVPEFYNDISESIRAFYEVDLIELSEEGEVTLFEKIENGTLIAKADFNGCLGEYTEKIEATDEISLKRIKKHGAKLAMYNALKKASGRILPWGSLTGIRPTKLLRDHNGDIDLLNQKYDLPLEKGKLLQRIIANQQEFFVPQKDELDVYIGIPFCPTRCLYCSFTSQSIAFSNKLTEPYVNALKKEIEEISKTDFVRSKKIESVYFGGGTPTALDANRIDEIINCLKNNFDFDYLRNSDGDYYLVTIRKYYKEETEEENGNWDDWDIIRVVTPRK